MKKPMKKQAKKEMPMKEKKKEMSHISEKRIKDYGKKKKY